eukprot:CAMPEP_0206045212 /NCGR_PEP_ID=MMETSP1466-20131121/15312_1 /ASSEMBLY_ACC=CAM_ASM_001126 /TAXON_ID=44452 /ORGANISM="Pavlova gyrans, Strain CCMP608" /LENGTH=196 /DNA_ID=CAMNT_0053420141 /DNA_START=42 /DNA_END=632 /DNA_ORIENTATION=-
MFRTVSLLALTCTSSVTAFAPTSARLLTRSAVLRGGARMIAEGDKLPEGDFMVIKDGPTPLASKDVFSGKKVVLFGLPGAMTPTCSEKQLPGFIELADKFKEKGVDTIACLAVNDPFVMKEWSKAKDPKGIVLMLGDGGAAFTKAAGLDFDTGNFGGVRCKRCAMIVDDGKVVKLGLEEGGAFEGASSAESMLKAL